MLVVDLQKKWHSFQLNVTFKIPPGKVTVLFGPSGAGKSSILHFVSGLATADNGSIRNGNDIWFDKKNNINLSGAVVEAIFMKFPVAERNFLAVKKIVEVVVEVDQNTAGKARQGRAP